MNITTYSKGRQSAALVASFTGEVGTIEVFEASSRFYIKHNGTQVGQGYGSKEPAILKAQSVAYLGERI